MEMNNVTYGNPTIEYKKILTETCLVSDLFAKLKSESFPSNDSELTKDELNEIVDYLASIKETDNVAFLKRYKAYDRSLSQVLISTFKQRNLDLDELVKEIISDIRALIFKLKYYYQRPRPYQLADYYKLALFPYTSHSDDTPSYPSGHGVEAYVILNIIGNKYPKEYSFCKEVIDDVMLSREYLGLHYSSDNDFAITVGKEILKHKEFAKKYGI
jgi:hypothetical protein